MEKVLRMVIKVSSFYTWILSKDVVLAVQYNKYSKFT